jgi:TolB-like protein
MDMGQGASEEFTAARRLAHLVAEMGRRRVWRTALGYGAVVFVLLQIGEIVFPAFGAPEWALRLLVVACFLAFPVVLCLAWVFDITPTGIRKTLGVSHSVEGGPGRALPRVALLAVTLAIVGGLGWWSVRDALAEGAEGSPGPGVDGTAAPAASTESPVIRSLAVLPLDDFSEEEGGAYFTAGLHEEIVSRLSQSAVARVVSRTSVVQYDRSGKTMPTIARDLGADAVLEGSVFRVGDRVRVTVQLIHGPTDTHLWADSYEGTLEDAIGFQRQVARTIAEAVGREISETTGRARPEKRLAGGVGIPEEYREGRRDEELGTREGLLSAMEHYRKVLEEDSSFVPARAGLETARIRLDLHSSARDTLDEERRIAGARRLAAAAHYREAEGILQQVLLTPEAPEEAWQALEQIKTVRGDFDGILELRFQRISRDGPDSMAVVALAELRNRVQEGGEEGYWAWRLEEMKKKLRDGEAVPPVEMARASVGVGDTEAAFPYLETALRNGDRNLVSLWVDPAWAVLRQDPRFREILTRIRESVGGGELPLPDLPWPAP